MQRWNKLKEKFNNLRKKRRAVEEQDGKFLPAYFETTFPLSYTTSNGGGTYFIPKEQLQQLTISMTDTDSQSITTLADAIRDGHLRKIEKLKLELSHCRINDDDIVNLMNVIMTTTQKQFRKIDLSSCMIGDKVALAIAKALESGCFPDDFELNLFESKIGDEGVKAIVRALTHPNCPSRQWLRLDNNDVTTAGAVVIRDMFRNIQCKRNLKLIFSNFRDKSMLEISDEIRTLQYDYHNRFDAQLCLTFYLGLTDAESPVSILNKNLDVMRIISAHVFQAGVKHNFNHPSLLFSARVHEFYKRKIRDKPQSINVLTRLVGF